MEEDENTDVNEFEKKARWIQSLAEKKANFDSPVDINLSYAVPVELSPLKWTNYEIPCKKMKLTNSGHTIILSAKWYQERPFIRGGPFLGKYVFSQLHFHWGQNDLEGSEHTIDGGHMPLEMHAIHFKSVYLSQEAALKERDGIVVLVYFMKLQTQDNPAIEFLIDSMTAVRMAHTSTRMPNLAISFLVNKFESDYYLYWGSVTTTSCTHIILWIICREPIGISIRQIERFRMLLDVNDEPLIRNFRDVQPLGTRNIFHISPSGSKYSTLLPISQEQFLRLPPKPAPPRTED